MKAKLIKNEDEYKNALEHIEILMDAEPGSTEEGELDLFAHLVELYEAEHYAIELPDPIEAIKFRMDQAGLTRKDMRQYLGSQSKVSEVLNYKRPLSLKMIRALHKDLGIPADVLLQESGGEIKELKYNFRDYPFNEMFKRGYFAYFHGGLWQAKDFAEELLIGLFEVFGGNPPEPVYCRNSFGEINQNALIAWQARVLAIAKAEKLPSYSTGVLTEKFVSELVKLSYYSKGPQLAIELLNKNGIHLIILPHLTKTYLDGTCTISPWGNSVIGMTLRFDRLDNFWFTLMHEMAHLFLHIEGKGVVFFFVTESLSHSEETPYESEANQWARDRLIHPENWGRNAPVLLETQESEEITCFAEDLRISPAIVAGRIRWERGDYRVHSNLIGRNSVREQFAEYG